MAVLTTTIGVLVIESLANWVQFEHHVPIPATVDPSIPVGSSLVDWFPLNLTVLDLSANGAVALVILLIGYSIVRHGILIERSLARRGFFEQWRGIGILAPATPLLLVFPSNFSNSS